MLEEYSVSVLNQNPAILKFIPRESSMVYKVIESVTVIFREDESYIYQISVEEKNGDSMLITFYATQLNAPIGKEAWEVSAYVRQ